MTPSERKKIEERLTEMERIDAENKAELEKIGNHYGLKAGDLSIIRSRCSGPMKTEDDRRALWEAADDLIYERANREESGKKCKCGSARIKHPIHIDWCPAAKRSARRWGGGRPVYVTKNSGIDVGVLGTKPSFNAIINDLFGEKTDK